MNSVLIGLAGVAWVAGIAYREDDHAALE